MELLLSLAVGLMFGCGVWLVLRRRTFSAVLGLTILAYAVNLLIFLGGRIDRTTAPLTLPGASGLADPLPQALVLTAIVIGFGMTAYLVALSLKALGQSHSDRIDLPPDADPADDGPRAGGP
ncbi:MAG: Na+/H+ antiporter subunit C [Thermaurantiacus sp.]